MAAGQRAFRFGVVGTPQENGEQWRNVARRAEDLGYAVLLMPDGLQLLSSEVSLAIAGSATTRLRVGTFVLASPLRPPYFAAWQAHSLSVLLDGRFEMGIGTGRPEAAQDAETKLGLPVASPARRLAQVAQTIDHLREMDGKRHTPVMMAVSGPKAMAMAAAKADIVAVATGPLASRDEFGQVVSQLKRLAGARADQIELSTNVFVVGDQVPPWMNRFLQADAATLIAHDSLTMLRGTPREIADELLRRRDTFGVSYVTVNGAFMEPFAPVIALLAGR